MLQRRSYTARINRVMDHIDAHLDETLDLQALAGVAQFSPFHFHRLFQSLTGETLANRGKVGAGLILAGVVLGELIRGDLNQSGPEATRTLETGSGTGTS